MKKSYVCTWCSQQVAEEDFELHTAKHYVEQQSKWEKNPSTTFTTMGSVSYVKETTQEAQPMCKDSKIISNFIEDFAIEKGLNPDYLISVKVDAKHGVTYEYLDKDKREIHTVSELS